MNMQLLFMMYNSSLSWKTGTGFFSCTLFIDSVG